jgi:hypothetical protein
MTLFLLAACQSHITGNEGNFTFAYWTDDDVVDFNKPIAVGASLDIEVADVAASLPVSLTAASTSDEAVLTVGAYEGHVVTVTGVADGEARLFVEGTTSAGELLPDSIDLLVREPEVLRLAHTCTGQDGTAAYLAGQRVWVPFDLETGNGQSVIGYGLYPVTVSGEGAALNAAESDQTWMAFDTTAAGTVTLASAIDDAALTMEVVSPEQIDGVAQPIPFVVEDIDVGDTNAFYVHPTAGGATVCQGDTAKTVVSDTPDVCDVRDADAADANLHEFGWFEIEGLAAGTCAYTVTFTASGASAQFEFPIEP